jgi:4'-phosphopantetheinyl transferase
VWSAALDQPAEVVQRLHGLLAAAERARADRFHFDRDRQRFIVGRGVLRSILGGYLKIAPDRLTFEYGAQGKPGLSSSHASALHFNVAHSHELAVYAFALNQAVGIDVEYALRHVSDADQVAQRFFAANEYQTYQALADDEKRPAFFRCWTRKEAYIKAIGTGLSHALDRFEVTLAPDRPPAFLSIDGDPLAAQHWSLIQLEPAADYIGAVAIANRAWHVAGWRWACSLIDSGGYRS